MNILDVLKQDHEAVKQLFEQIQATEDGKERGELFAKCYEELDAHAKAEEQVFYKRLLKKGDEEAEEEVFEGQLEHELVEQLLARLDKQRNKAQPRWSASVKVLKELVEHHVEEEEGEYFKTAQQTFSEDELNRMGEEFMKEKDKLMQGGGTKKKSRAA